MSPTIISALPDEDAARTSLTASDHDIAELLSAKSGVAFVGSARVTPASRAQWARYGDIPIYIVNPKGGEAEGATIVPTVRDLPDEVDLVIIRIAPAAAVDALRQCGERGIRNVLIFTDGYSEIGVEGARLEAELAETVRKYTLRVVGPNTNDNAFEKFPKPAGYRGKEIALITQSGANGRSVVEGVNMGAAFHRWVTTGNEIDLEVADFIHHFAGLDKVGVIALYVEGFKSPIKLRLALERALEAGKPVVALKMGATEKGARSAASHTGHLAGSDAVMEGLFRQYGVTRVRDIDELLEFSNLFSKVPLDTGSRCGMYTVSGGTATLMAENADLADLDLPENSEELQEQIYQHIPRNVSVRNPVDNGGVYVMTSSPESRVKVLDLIASNPDIDLVVVGLNAAYGPLSDRMAEDVLSWAPGSPKPTVAVWTSVVTDTQGYADLVASGVPIFRSFNKCMRGIAARERFLQARKRHTRSEPASMDLKCIVENILSRPGIAGAEAASDLLAKAGIALAGERLARTADEAVEAARDFDSPVVLKLMSAAIPHKTECGFVRLNVTNPGEVRIIAQDFLDRGTVQVGADRIEGVLVQEHVPPGVEMIIGLSQDDQFGPAITIGMGGIYAEVFRDVVTLPLPVTEADIRDAISGLKVSALLDGARGAAPADREGLVLMALAVARLGLAAGPRIAELDLNPVIVLQDRAIAVDSLLVAGPSNT